MWISLTNLFISAYDDEEVDQHVAAIKFKEKLDDLMYDKTQVIENKRMMFVKRQIEIEDMDEGVLKKRLLYSQEVIMNNPVNQEERELHEAYQFIIREYECRHRESDISEISEVNLKETTPAKKKSKKKNKTRSAEVVSMYRGKKSLYEKVAEASSVEEIQRELSVIETAERKEKAERDKRYSIC